MRSAIARSGGVALALTVAMTSVAAAPTRHAGGGIARRAAFHERQRADINYSRRLIEFALVRGSDAPISDVRFGTLYGEVGVWSSKSKNVASIMGKGNAKLSLVSGYK